MTRSLRTIHGILPVFQTPYHDNGEIDDDTLAVHLNDILDQGAHGVTMAMVSEVLRLAFDERMQLAESVCRIVGGRGFKIISVGAESTHTAVRLARHAQEVGADAVMAIPPVATGCMENQLAAYYRRIIQAIDIPVIVQDASGYVGKPMSIDLQASLMHEFGPDRVLFKPEAQPIGPRLTELLDATDGKARTFEGTGGIALIDSYQRGIVGTMPGGDLVDVIVALWNALENHDLDRAYQIHNPLTAMICLQNSLDSFLAVEKYLLHKRGIFKNTFVRGPVGYQLDEPTRKQVDTIFALLLEQVKHHGTTP